MAQTQSIEVRRVLSSVISPGKLKPPRSNLSATWVRRCYWTDGRRLSL